VACVPVLSDRVMASRLAALPGLVLDAAAVDAEVESGGDSGDPAVAAARAMLALPGVTGINLSGAASRESIAVSATAMARVGREVRARERA
jgi:methylenetetrahydrofolate reductase (NADPH)